MLKDLNIEFKYSTPTSLHKEKFDLVLNFKENEGTTNFILGDLNKFISLDKKDGYIEIKSDVDYLYIKENLVIKQIRVYNGNNIEDYIEATKEYWEKQLIKTITVKNSKFTYIFNKYKDYRLIFESLFLNTDYYNLYDTDTPLALVNDFIFRLKAVIEVSRDNYIFRNYIKRLVYTHILNGLFVIKHNLENNVKIIKKKAYEVHHGIIPFMNYTINSDIMEIIKEYQVDVYDEIKRLNNISRAYTVITIGYYKNIPLQVLVEKSEKIWILNYDKKFKELLYNSKEIKDIEIRFNKKIML